MKRLLIVVTVGMALAAVVWAQDAARPRVRDTKIESFAREVPGAVTVDTKPKPRAWSFVRTTESGTFSVVLRSPSGVEQALAEVSVIVPDGKIGSISVRTSVALMDEVKPPVERVEP